MLKIVEKEILFLDPAVPGLAGVAHGDGQLLVAGCAVDADPAHHVGDALLLGGGPGQGPLLGVVVAHNAVVVILLICHGVNIVVGLPDKVHNIAS